MILLALLVAAAPQFDSVWNPRWTRDGSALVYSAAITAPDNDDGSRARELGPSYSFKVVAEPTGEVRQVFQDGQNLTSGPDDRGEPIWQAAKDAAAYEAWEKQHALAPAPDAAVLRFEPGKQVSKPVAVKLGGKSIELTEQKGKQLQLGDSTLFRAPPGAKTFSRSTSIWVAPSPDGTRTAVIWAVEDAKPAGMTENVISRGFLAVLGEHALAAVDLLDAGAGQGADAAELKLVNAGFRVAHRSKAQKARPATAVYFTEGFEADAKAAAALLGAQTVEPATWKTPFAITVAAAR